MDNLVRAVGVVECSGRELGNLESLPRAWEALVLLWLTRTTQLAGVPGYDGREPLTVFGSDDADNDEGDEEMDELGDLVSGATLD